MKLLEVYIVWKEKELLGVFSDLELALKEAKKIKIETPNEFIVINLRVLNIIGEEFLIAQI